MKKAKLWVLVAILVIFLTLVNAVISTSPAL